MCAILKDLEYPVAQIRTVTVPAAVKVRIEEWIVAADIYEGRISPDAEPLTYSEARQILSNAASR